MRKVIRKRIRRDEEGLNLAADVDAVIAINTGGDKKSSHSVVHSSHRVVQGGAGRRDQPDKSPSEPDGPAKEKP